MTDFAQASRPESIAVVGPRHDAFRAAGRHTTRVRILRRVVLFGAVAGTLLLIVFAFAGDSKITRD